MAGEDRIDHAEMVFGGEDEFAVAEDGGWVEGGKEADGDGVPAEGAALGFEGIGEAWEDGLGEFGW